GLQKKDAAETGNHVDTEKGDNENLEDEVALTELEAAEKAEKEEKGDNENLEDEAALAELEAAEKAEKGLQKKDAAETGNHVGTEKGDNENLEDEAALAE
ncbi:hypothetical protein MKW92_005563, partial [Papaver armeniacum]